MNWQHRPRCDETAAWPLLQAHFDRAFSGPAAFDLRRAFAQDPARLAALSFDAPPLWADLSKNLIDPQAQRLLNQLAEQCGVLAHRDAMLRGERINVSEGRAVTHVHWRWALENFSAIDNMANAAPQAAAMQAEVLAYAEAVRGGGAITDVVHIGIGGSDLGPRMAVQALHASGPRVHFAADMGGRELAALLPRLKPVSTLFIIASKTFGTVETLCNAQAARQWFMAQNGADAARHFVALSVNREAARAFGAGRCFAFDDGVGGRFSLWSPIGLPVAIAAGRAGFLELLAGARTMDLHFARAPLERNLPVQLALLDLWYRNFHRAGSRCVTPYHHGLRTLPAWLQQLEMESNGKRVDLHGRVLAAPSAPVTWGQTGSNGQHAFFQMLHQGSEVVPVEFVLVRHSPSGLPGHHDKLLANALAQARALMLGQTGDAPERHFPGNRPSTMLLLPDLSPRSLGALLALYEHRAFALGSLWGINSFDQWGVELGKRHAGEIETALRTGQGPALDASTAGLLERLRGM